MSRKQLLPELVAILTMPQHDVRNRSNGMGIREFCNEHGLEMGYSGGYFISGNDGRGLTGYFPTVEILEREVLPRADEILMADRVAMPSERTISRYLANLEKAEAEIARNRPVRLAKYEELLPYAGSNEIVEEGISNMRRVIDATPLHLAEIERCRSLAVNAPSRLFLPLGAAVRLKREWNVADHYAMDPSLLSYISARRVSRPPEGSVGYVTGAGYGSDETGVAVAFPDEFVDGNGMAWKNDLYGVVKLVALEDLEIIDLAVLPDGTPNISVDASSPTHVADYGDGDVADILILENGGRKMFFFVGDDYSPFDERVQFFESMSDALKIHDEVRSVSAPATPPSISR